SCPWLAGETRAAHVHRGRMHRSYCRARAFHNNMAPGEGRIVASTAAGCTGRAQAQDCLPAQSTIRVATVRVFPAVRRLRRPHAPMREGETAERSRSTIAAT